MDEENPECQIWQTWRNKVLLSGSVSDLAEVLWIFFGMNCFSHPGVSAGFALDLLLVRLTVLYLAGHEKHYTPLSEHRLLVAGVCRCVLTYIAGLLAGLLWHHVSRCEMSWEAAFTSLLLVLLCVGILERRKTQSYLHSHTNEGENKDWRC